MRIKAHADLKHMKVYQLAIKLSYIKVDSK